MFNYPTRKREGNPGKAIHVSRGLGSGTPETLRELQVVGEVLGWKREQEATERQDMEESVPYSGARVASL